MAFKLLLFLFGIFNAGSSLQTFDGKSYNSTVITNIKQTCRCDRTAWAKI